MFFRHRCEVIYFEKPSLTPPGLSQILFLLCSQGLSFCPPQSSSETLTAGLSVTLTRLQGQELCVCPVLHQILNLWQLN